MAKAAEVRLIYSDAELPPTAKTEIDARIIARRLIKLARAVQHRPQAIRNVVLKGAAQDYYEKGNRCRPQVSTSEDRRG